LGTFVEVQINTNDPRIFAAAFRAIENVSTRMSFHDPKSELCKLNRAPVGKWIKASPGLRTVLKLGLELGELTDQRFNLAVALPLIHAGKLPGQVKNPNWKLLSEAGLVLQGSRVQKRSAVKVDLGGIAKGYAVDQAVKAILKLNPKVSGCINAGGDLFVFGARAQTVSIRVQPGVEHALNSFQIRNQAIATSVVRSPHASTAYVDIRKHSLMTSKRSATVMAPSCMVADALTKVVLFSSRAQAKRIAARFEAKILSLS
jgi:thiamine biosynthesis lipoprotein